MDLFWCKQHRLTTLRDLVPEIQMIKNQILVISTPKPRERVVPQTPQPSPAPPIPVIVLPVAPQR